MSAHVLDEMRRQDFENVVFCHDKVTRLRAVIAVHDTTLGPGFGGTRMRTYPTEADALADAMALALGMTYKNAAAGLNVGGAKGVILADADTAKTEAMLRAYGRFVERLGGLFITAADYGITPADVAHMHTETSYAVAIPETGPRGGSIAAATAVGLIHGMRAAVHHALGIAELDGLRVTVQGAGAVGSHVVRLLVESGAKVIVGDVDRRRLRELEPLGVDLVENPTTIHRSAAEMFCPCAVGGVLSRQTVDGLGARIVAGAANNQLASVDAAIAMHERGVLYAPDFIVNAGGISYAADRGVDGRPHEEAMSRLDRIAATTSSVLAAAAAERILPHQAAERLAERRLVDVRAARAVALPTTGRGIALPPIV